MAEYEVARRLNQSTNEWETVVVDETGGGSLPVGGSTGEVLTKLSNADGDADWEAGGGSQTVYVQDADPGAVGEGKVWVGTSGDPPLIYLRDSDNAAWYQVVQSGGSTGEVLSKAADTDYAFAWVSAGGAATLGDVLNSGNDAGGQNIDNGGDFTMGGATITGPLAHSGSTAGFFGANPVSVPNIAPIADPASASAEDVANAYNALLDVLGATSLGLLDAS